MAKKGGVTTEGREAIDTVPLPEDIPMGGRFQYGDSILLQDLNAVFEKHGWKGSIARLEFDSGMHEPPKFCFRVCVPGPDDRPICWWVCPGPIPM